MVSGIGKDTNAGKGQRHPLSHDAYGEPFPFTLEIIQVERERLSCELHLVQLPEPQGPPKIREYCGFHLGRVVRYGPVT